MQWKTAPGVLLGTIVAAMVACSSSSNGGTSSNVTDPTGGSGSSSNSGSSSGGSTQGSTSGGSSSGTGSSGGTSSGGTSSGGTSSGTTVGTGAPHAAPLSSYTFSHEWYVAPSGSDSAQGTSAAPFRTITKALSVVSAGERINVAAGDYAERVSIADSVASGTADKPIALAATNARVLPATSNYAMIDVKKPYWIIDGFEVDARGAAHAGVAFTGDTQGDVLSHCNIHNGTADTAVYIAANAIGVTVDSNNIHDYWVDQRDAHGVAIEWTVKNVTITNNSIHDVSGDSVQCEGPETYADGATPADNVLIEGNDMTSNGEQAVDIKTCTNVTVRKNNIHDFLARDMYGGGCPMVIHMSAANVTVEDNLFTNAGKAIQIGGNTMGAVPTNITVRKNRFVGMHLGNPTLDGTAIRIADSNNTHVFNNTFTQIEGPAMIIGDGESGNTSHLTVENNVFDAPTAVKLYTHYDSLAFIKNLYLPTAKFMPPSGSGGISAWQSLGLDTGAVVATPDLSADLALTPGPVEIDKGADVGLPYCGSAPDLGAVEVCQ